MTKNATSALGKKTSFGGRRGLMLVLSSPSGAGKTSISRCLLAGENDLELSVSATTRKRRPGEVEGLAVGSCNAYGLQLRAT